MMIRPLKFLQLRRYFGCVCCILIAFISLSPKIALPYVSIKSSTNELAPVLRPVPNLSLNFKSINPQYSSKNGILIAELLSYIERLYPGRQFSTISTDISPDKTQFGIAITDIIIPDNVEGLLTANGNNFPYRLINGSYKGLARMIEPHQKISFQPLNSSQKNLDYEVKIKFRLWDLREREQLSPFNWYRLDNVGGQSPFSLQEQELSIKITTEPPHLKPPFWDYAKNPKDIFINLNVSNTFQSKVEDLIKGQDGEIILRDESNRPLGLMFLNWNVSSARFYYRRESGGEPGENEKWLEFNDSQQLKLRLSDMIKIEFDSLSFQKQHTTIIKGWDGTFFDSKNSLTNKYKIIKFIFYK